MSDGIDHQSLPFVSSVEWHALLGSTNDRARELARTSAALPALVVADRQTAGRGRGANRWWASAGALTFSLLINPERHGIVPSRQGLLAIATGLAVIDAVRETTGLSARLKWPNDVLLDGKKLAGVLIEAVGPERWIVGVGANVENRLGAAPPEIRARAVTLAEAPGAGKAAVLESCLTAFGRRIAQIASGDPELIGFARSRCALTGVQVKVVDGNRTIAGECHGLAEDGALLLYADGATTAMTAGSVERLDQPSA
ncbi:biotin--[acetyl-CoA-carboxylase] ligase [Botrimarina sp.]|uniref:biotin--[acetyl-CoA-carboxylase] ligase n=1 Tax=Botrimarina sp. TaxID=2795802 RepID=UPI0032EC7E22